MKKFSLTMPKVRGLGLSNAAKSDLTKWGLVGAGGLTAVVGYKNWADPQNGMVERTVAAGLGLAGAVLAASLVLGLKRLF